MKIAKGKLKICSRGHKYQGGDPCPICWPNRLKNKNTKKVKLQPYTKYHNDGSIWTKGKMVDGVCDGYWEWFRKDGTKMRSGHFKKGKNVGEWITYDKTGKIYKVTSINK